MKTKFGDNLKSLREEENVSQITIAKLCKTTVATVSRWENYINQPDIDTLILLADFFKVTLDELLR